MCQSSWVISIAKLNDRCFCHVTAAIFVSLRRTRTWRLLTKLWKFGWHSSANSTRMKNSRDLILSEVLYIAIIYHITDSWIFLLNGYDFYFDHMTGENREFAQLQVERLSDHRWRLIRFHFLAIFASKQSWLILSKNAMSHQGIGWIGTFAKSILVVQIYQTEVLVS